MSKHQDQCYWNRGRNKKTGRKESRKVSQWLDYIKSYINHGKDSGFYYEHGMPVENFKQGLNMIQFYWICSGLDGAGIR